MDKKSKILIWVFVILTLLSVGFTAYKTLILQDFETIDTSEWNTEEEEYELDLNEEIVVEDDVVEEVEE